MQRALVSLICVVGIVGCGKQQGDEKVKSNNFTNSINPQGGQDSGGGGTRGSSKQFVFDILRDKKRLTKDLEEILWNLDPKSFSGAKELLVINWNKAFHASQIQLTEKLSTLKIKKNCQDKEGEIKPASVTEFNGEGEICISYPLLMAIPAESLRKQIHALLFHEITHLMGYRKEEIPNQIQEIILTNYDNLFINLNSNSYLEEIFIIEMNNSKNFLKKISKLPDNYFLSGQILKDKKFIDDYNDKSRKTFPVLIKSATSLFATLETKAQADPTINLKLAQDHLSQIILLPYKMDELRNIVQNGGIKKGYVPLYFKLEKDSNDLLLKKEFQRAVSFLESTEKAFEYMNKDRTSFWQHNTRE